MQLLLSVIRCRCSIGLFLTTLFATTLACGQQPPADLLQTLVRSAKPGSTITLPAGTFTGGISLPSRVSLRGAGCEKTIIDASKVANGIVVANGDSTVISDVTIRGAANANIQVTNARRIILRRVIARDGLTGVSFDGVTRGRIENTLAAGNRYGLLLNGGMNNTVVNCTAVQNSSIGISLSTGQKPVVFNTTLIGNATGLLLGGEVKGALVDYNLYYSLYVGKFADQLARLALGDWQSVSGQDAHSVQFPVTMQYPDHGNYRATNALDWALNRAVTSDWGTTKFAGITAPTTDISGRPRSGQPDLGVYEIVLPTSRPADGTFTIKSDTGIKSAGIFTREGREVAYLFQNIPLRKGSYAFWFPARTFEGKEIPAGNFDIRVAESQLHWKYLGWVGDTGTVADRRLMSSIGPNKIYFDEQGHLFLGSGWSEDDTDVRCYDAVTGNALWGFPGRTDPLGFATGADGFLYMLRNFDKGQGHFSRLDPKVGRIQMGWGVNGNGQIFFDNGAVLRDLVRIDDTLFVADPAAGDIRYGPIKNPIPFAGSFPTPGVQSLGVDQQTKLLWACTQQGKLQAFTKDGTKVADYDPQLTQVAAMAVRNGVLVLASRATGKVHFFDIRNPQQVKPGKTLGRGDGPYGKFLPDRFTFQQTAVTVQLALGPDNSLAVVDDKRVLVFAADDTLRWMHFGVGSNGIPSYADPTLEYVGNFTLQMDEKLGSWKLDGFWNIQNPDPPAGKLLGVFSDKGHTFLVRGMENSFDVDEFVGTGAKTVLRLTYSAPGILVQRDANHDGALDAETSLMARKTLPGRWAKLCPNGDVIASMQNDGWATWWHYGGLDKDNVPRYDSKDAVVFPRDKTSFTSPFTYELEETVSCLLGVPTKSGNIVANLWAKSSPFGTGWSNTAGTDMGEINKDGTLRWFYPLGVYGGTPGIGNLDGIYIEGVCTNPQIIAVNADGLGLGSAGLPASINYDGFWIDYENAIQGYVSTDGHRYAIIGDNIKGCGHWFRLEHDDQIITTTQPVMLSAESAARLKLLPVVKPQKNALRPPTPVIHIPKLATPLPIDGDMEKWRTAGITPQVVITPETASGGITGPKDCSAIIRLAYEGNNLYVQVLRFDNLVSFHQPMAKSYLQDNLEMCLNGFMDGCKFMCSPVTDLGTALFAQRFMGGDYIVPEAHAPRIVKVLDSAKDVSERKIIEGVYGIDMSACKVIITELKIPIDVASFPPKPDWVFPVAPGKSFWIGFLIDDNDEPGSDVQHFMFWPATYGTFQPKEDSALAIFD